jgi:hypothetical protein
MVTDNHVQKPSALNEVTMTSMANSIPGPPGVSQIVIERTGRLQ